MGSTVQTGHDRCLVDTLCGNVQQSARNGCRAVAESLSAAEISRGKNTHTEEVGDPSLGEERHPDGQYEDSGLLSLCPWVKHSMSWDLIFLK